MRPWAFGDVWDRMTPRQRRFAAWTDILVGVGGTLLVYLVVSWWSQ